MDSHLHGGKTNIAKLYNYCNEKLFTLIDKCNGTKAIFWDDYLSKTIGLIATYSSLKEHGVLKMFLLNDMIPEMEKLMDVKSIIFISRPHLNLMNHIAKIVHREEKSGIRKDFYLFFLPRENEVCKKRLENAGVYGNFLNRIDSLLIDIFPFESDLISMEIETSFKDYYVDQDPSSLYQAAEAIMTLQHLYGKIPKICGKGSAAKHVWDIVERLTNEERECSQVESSIDQLILIDRAIDLITPMATQLTYEGLIDEIFGISNGSILIPAEKCPSIETNIKKVDGVPMKQIILNGGDEHYAEIRDKNFNAVGSLLSKKANLLSTQMKGRHDDQTMQEMQQFVAKLPRMLASKKSVTIHTAIAEMVKLVTDSTDFLNSLQLEQELLLGLDTDRIQNYIEDCIAHEKSIVQVLRLICLQSATNSGLKPKILEYYKREIIQTYGFEHFLTLNNLEKCGLLKIQQGRGYTVLRKMLQLTVEDGSEIEPNDISYVHSVYAPLSVRLINKMLKSSINSLNVILNLLPGPVVDTQQSIDGINRNPLNGPQNSNTKCVLVFFLGGCTFAEISSLRFLSQLDSNVEFVIATTKLINGNSFINSLRENAVEA